MTSLSGVLLLALSILSYVDGESLTFHPQTTSLLDGAVVDCSAAFFGESLQVEGDSPALRLGLVNKHGPCSPLKSTVPFGSVYEFTEEMLAHEENRVRFLQSKMAASLVGTSEAEGTQAPLVSTTSIGAGIYLVKVGLGTPATELMLSIDTGSEIMWTQCSPCASTSACYAQDGPIFNPQSSSSYATVPCGGPVCSALGALSAGGCAGSVCGYQVQYLDGSFTKGDFSTDTLTVGGAKVDGFQFGCGHDNEGFKGIDGIMGLDRGLKSFPTQTTALFGRNLAYCLPAPLSTSSGFIEFGTSAAPSATRTPFSTFSESFYVADLTSVAVGGAIISTSSAVPLIIDSGTIISRLSTQLYNSLRDSFKASVSGLTPASASVGLGLFDTCFTESSSPASIPPINFILSGGVTFAPTASSILYPVGTGTYCLAFAPLASDSGVSILGNFQQQGFRMAFDVASKSLSIDPNAC